MSRSSTAKPEWFRIFATSFQAIEKEVSLYFVMHPDARSTEKPKLELEVIRGGQSIKRIPFELQANSGASAIPYMTSLNGGSLEPGHYETKAILTQRAKKAESSVLFTFEEAAAKTHAAFQTLPPRSPPRRTTTPTSGAVFSHHQPRRWRLRPPRKCMHLSRAPESVPRNTHIRFRTSCASK